MVATGQEWSGKKKILQCREKVGEFYFESGKIKITSPLIFICMPLKAGRSIAGCSDLKDACLSLMKKVNCLFQVRLNKTHILKKGMKNGKNGCKGRLEASAVSYILCLSVQRNLIFIREKSGNFEN